MHTWWWMDEASDLDLSQSHWLFVEESGIQSFPFWPTYETKNKHGLHSKRNQSVSDGKHGIREWRFHDTCFFIQYSAEESCINFYQLQIFISSEHIYMTKLRQKWKVRQYYLDKWHLVMLNDPTLFPKFNFLILTCLFREMPVRVTVNQMDQIFMKLNTTQEQTSSVLSWGQRTSSLSSEQRAPWGEHLPSAHCPCLCNIGFYAICVLPAIAPTLFPRMLQALLTCGNNLALLRFQKHAREVKYRFPTGEGVF